MKTQLTLALLAAAAVLCPSPASAQLDASCAATVTYNFDPPARIVLPPTPAPHSTATGGGTIAACAVSDQGPTTGTFTFELEGNLTCLSAENVAGTVEITWADNTQSQAEITTLVLDLGSVGGAAGLTATVTGGRFEGDQLQIVNLRDPTALLKCLLHGLSQTSGTTNLTFTQPVS
jgi:hypothetical protein